MRYPIKPSKLDNEGDSSPLLTIAREAITMYMDRSSCDLPYNSRLYPSQLGVFVTVKVDQRLRGCIGHIDPVYPYLDHEVFHCARLAAFQDPRFPPLNPKYLDRMTLEINLLLPYEKVELLSDLDPRVYGILVTDGRKKGFLLPDLPGVLQVEHQLAIALTKAQLEPEDNYDLYRFKIRKVSEQPNRIVS